MNQARVFILLHPEHPLDDTVAIVRDTLGRDCEIVGVHVEDENLVRLARLPIAKEVVRARHDVRAMTGELLEADFAMQSQVIRRRFEQAASALRCRYSFEVRRGLVVTELMADTGVLVVSRALSVAEFVTVLHRSGRGTVLLVNEPWRKGNGVLVLTEGLVETGRRMANAFAERQHLTVHEVAIAAEDEAGFDQLAARCVREGTRLLVVAKDVAQHHEAAFTRLYATTDTSLLLVSPDTVDVGESD